MTDTFSPPITNGLDGTHTVLPLQHTIPILPPTESLAETVDDDGQISCFCGINEDDGNTVACDSCNRWQHIICYYPANKTGTLPEDMQHYCIECQPRPVDVVGAISRQQQARESLFNGVKRAAPKSQKKRNKDIITNGWPLEKRQDNSASPREGFPNKRPKTSHRTSNSTSHPRKRSASVVHHRSASFSPDSVARTYSPEFIEAYLNCEDYTVPEANCFSSLAIGSKLATWLCDPDEVQHITNGKEQQDLFQRWDGDISAIDPQTELIDIQEAADPRVRGPDGTAVQWRYATVREPLAAQACIGELRGTVGLKEDYENDPANRWSIMRHPEPFVFYHAHLPICIDTRQEGTVVRFVRRSCNPNAELKIIITGQDYHFCFMATRDIEAGEEIAIAWDCARTVADMISARTTDAVSRNDLDSLQQWVSTVLSNCGPCACNRADCLMARFDRRFDEPKPKGRKRKPAHISPLNTMAVNSRSGSEVRKLDPDDEPTDSRSTSGSLGKGSASRDITPSTHYSANGTLPELSERERKKLAQTEEMFRRQEEEAVGKQSKKKRTSSGMTPSSAKTPVRLDAKRSMNKATSVRRKPRSPVEKERTKVAYIDAGSQCDMDAEEAAAKARIWTSASFTARRMPVLLHTRLLDRCTRTNAMWRRNTKLETGPQAELTDENTRRQSAMDGHPAEPPEPPWNHDHTQESHHAAATEDMKLEMPPPIANPFSLESQMQQTTTPTGITQSPLATSTLLSPPTMTTANTPMRKKLSLSDYTRRSKAKDTEPKTDRESSPSSIASGPATTLVDQKKDGLTAVTEDTEMDDVVATSAIP